MANIRVTCPTCNSELEIDDEFVGQEVECGNCLQVFVAEGPKKSGSSSRRSSDDEEEEEKPRKKKKKKRRREEDDDDYDYDEDYYSPPSRGGGGTGLAVTALVLGILAVFPGCCCGFLGIPLSIGAIITGGIAMKNPEGKGMAITGIVLGIIMLALTILSIVVNIGMGGMNNPNQFR
jgi:predicted Zn finger-like uncharacterized protein